MFFEMGEEGVGKSVCLAWRLGVNWSRKADTNVNYVEGNTIANGKNYPLFHCTWEVTIPFDDPRL